MTNRKRDIEQEIIDGINEIEAGGGKRYMVEMPAGVKLIRLKMNLSQAEFAACLNISLRTLQEWEQGTRKPSGPASALLDIACEHPEIFLARDRKNPKPRIWE